MIRSISTHSRLSFRLSATPSCSCHLSFAFHLISVCSRRSLASVFLSFLLPLSLSRSRLPFRLLTPTPVHPSTTGVITRWLLLLSWIPVLAIDWRLTAFCLLVQY
ncbi:hypothetical protein BDV18DRAFT_5289 [Aspergillus unguis]